MSEPDCVTYEEYSKVLAENDALRSERDFFEKLYQSEHKCALVAEAKLAGGVVVPRDLATRLCEGIRRAIESRALDSRSMAADNALLLESVLTAAQGEK